MHLNAHTHADINRSEEEEEEEHEIIPDRSVALKQLAQSSCVFFNLTEWNAIIFFWMRMCFFPKGDEEILIAPYRSSYAL